MSRTVIVEGLVWVAGKINSLFISLNSSAVCHSAMITTYKSFDNNKSIQFIKGNISQRMELNPVNLPSIEPPLDIRTLGIV